MAFPIRNLPIVQKWDCHSCTDCCRIEAPVSAEEKERLEALDLSGDTEVGPAPWVVAHGPWWSRRWALRRRPDGSCVFLTLANRCRLHERFGPEAKPFACRLFPFVLIPAGSHWRVGLHYSCPSAAENKGRRLLDHDPELLQLAHLLEKHVGHTPDSAAPPPLAPRQQVGWPDLIRIVQALMEIVEDRSSRLERRLRRCLALAQVCRQARLENLSGGKLVEFLKLVGAGLDAEVPRTPAEVPPPTWLGRGLFRTLLAIFARKDVGSHQGSANRSRTGRVASGCRFILGRGPIPLVNAFLADMSFEEVERRPALPAEVDEHLERYYLTKLHSVQFCGPPNFDLSFWAGLDSLMLTFPLILWLARAVTASSSEAAVQKALLLVDDHFGGNPILRLRAIRYFLNTLSQQREIEKLLAWYSR